MLFLAAPSPAAVSPPSPVCQPSSSCRCLQPKVCPGRPTSLTPQPPPLLCQRGTAWASRYALNQVSCVRACSWDIVGHLDICSCFGVFFGLPTINPTQLIVKTIIKFW